MPQMRSDVDHRVRRWREQRWILDQVVKTVGVEFDQARIAYTLGPCGPDAAADFNAVRSRVQKFTDISREFARAAARRERIAERAEEEGRSVSARESSFIAALLFGSAQWPIFETTEENIRLDERKRECYLRYARYSDHPVRRVEIPFAGGKVIPGWLHLPSEASERPFPAVLGISGMDTFKEIRHALYGDRWLERGIAGLAIDGPGQGEALVSGDIRVNATNWTDAGAAALDWLRRQPEIDPERIAVFGASMGSFWATQVAASRDDLRACAVVAVCHEPSGHAIFNMASPTFKMRFMYMAGFEDEDEFDRWTERALDLRPAVSSITCPYLAVAGEDDDLSPIEHTYDLMDLMPGPKQLVVYEGALHGLHGSPSTTLGPNPRTLAAEWIHDRLAGKPLESQHVFVDVSGNMHVEDWDKRTRA
jgi:pimeloyl-ACP methyl ester carboxylesterase